MITSAQRRADLDHLAEALRAHLDAGGNTPPCANRAEWLSDDPDERAEAATACQHCPAAVFAACAVVGRSEHFGVWAGADRTPKHKPRQEAAA